MKDSAEDIKNTVEKAIEKANRERGRVANFIEDIKTLVRMMNTYMNDESFEMPKAVMIASAATLAYFINPFDAIPDFVAGVGFIDDAAVLTLMLNSFKKDITRFQRWEKIITETAETVS